MLAQITVFSHYSYFAFGFFNLLLLLYSRSRVVAVNLQCLFLITSWFNHCPSLCLHPNEIFRLGQLMTTWLERCYLLFTWTRAIQAREQRGPLTGHSLPLSALPTQNNPHCEMPVGKADKQFKQPQGTQVGGWVPERLRYRLIFSPLPKYTPALFQQFSEVNFNSKAVFYSTVLQILFHLLCSHQISKLFCIYFSLRWNGSKAGSLISLQTPPA